MVWPILAQLDWNAYHGSMITNCNTKFPEYAESFRQAVAAWDAKNASTIIEIRTLLLDRVRNAEGLSEAKASEVMRDASATWTDKFLEMVSRTSERDWKDVCTGKYAEQTLRSMDFVAYRSQILAAVPSLPVRQIRP